MRAYLSQSGISALEYTCLSAEVTVVFKNGLPDGIKSPVTQEIDEGCGVQGVHVKLHVIDRLGVLVDKAQLLKLIAG